MTEASAVPRHLLSVWNPSYADDAMDRHLEVLLRWAAQRKERKVPEEDVYVWWAKVRSPNRQGPLPHRDEVLALRDQVAAETETHLYLTDYSSLYVARIVDLTDADVRDHMPRYYEGLAADFWFQLWDIRRLVAKDSPATIEELRRLRNVRYHDRPVSLYGGMVDLPLIVTREDGATWFADALSLTGGRRWAERDAELRGETERLAAELRENLLGPDIWDALEPTTRTFLTTGEAIFRARRDDPGFDFGSPAVEYCKAVETELNTLMFTALARVLAGRPPHEREVRTDGGLVDLGKGRRVPHQTLGSLQRLLEKEPVVRRALEASLPHDWRWLEGVLPHQLEPLRGLRNPAAHNEAVTRGEIGRWRREILGIGCEGLLVRVVRAKMRGRA
jgi:hypothetical protein